MYTTIDSGNVQLKGAYKYLLSFSKIDEKTFLIMCKISLFPKFNMILIFFLMFSLSLGNYKATKFSYEIKSRLEIEKKIS